MTKRFQNRADQPPRITAVLDQIVYRCTGPGYFPRKDMSECEGRIVGFENDPKWGKFWLVQWDDEEIVNQIPWHGLNDPAVDKGIGVYLEMGQS